MRLGIIGAGNVGTSFLLALRSSIEIAGIMGSTPERTALRARELHTTGYADSAALLAHCDIVLLTVRDNAIGQTARLLAAHAAACTYDCSKKYIFHCSGALTADILQPLAELGCHIGSLHPLQSFAAPSAESLQNIYMAVDGDTEACQMALQLALLTGSHAFCVPPEERVLYHAAACFCSNYVVTAVAIAQELLSRWTNTPEEASAALLPLLDGTVRNLHCTALARTALTGPAARGDSKTIEKHLAVLPHTLTEPYCAFARIAATLAKKNGTITPIQYEELNHILTDRHEAARHT